MTSSQTLRRKPPWQTRVGSLQLPRPLKNPSKGGSDLKGGSLMGVPLSPGQPKPSSQERLCLRGH